MTCRRKPLFQNSVDSIPRVMRRAGIVLLLVANSGCHVAKVRLQATICEVPLVVAVDDDSICVSGVFPNGLPSNQELKR